MVGNERNPDAASDHDGMTADLVRRANGLDQALGQGGGCVLALDTKIGNQTELVAAKPCRHIPFAHGSPDAIGDLLQKRIASMVSEGIVHTLELVEVEHHHGKSGLLPAAFCKPLLNALLEKISIGKISQAIE